MAINIIVIATATILLGYWLRATWALVAKSEAERRRQAVPGLGELAPFTLWNEVNGPSRVANPACISHLP